MSSGKKRGLKRRLEDQVGDNATSISQGTDFKGTISGQNSVLIEGYLEGDIKIGGLLWVLKGGMIQGTVKANGVIIEGKINGNIEWTDKVEIRTGGRMNGNIKCGKIALAEGCIFQGEVDMPSEKQKPVTFEERRKPGDQQKEK